MHLALLGPVAAGKTSVGTRAARRLGMAWRDSDEQIEAELGATSEALAARDGVPALHAVELHMLEAALEDREDAVVAPAASVVDSPEGRRLLAADDVWCVLLIASVEAIAARLSSEDHRRHISHVELRDLIAQRDAHWRRLARVVYRTDEASPDDIVDDLVRHFPGP